MGIDGDTVEAKGKYLRRMDCVQRGAQVFTTFIIQETAMKFLVMQ
jgi:hypothetical protein